MGEWYDSRQSNVRAAGFYEVECETAEDGAFKSGAPHLKAYFRVIGGEFDGEGFEEKMPEFKVVAFAKALGFTPSKEAPFFTNELVGKRFSVEVEMHVYQGQTSPRVKPGGIRWTNRPGETSLPAAVQAPGDPQKAGDTPF